MTITDNHAARVDLARAAVEAAEARLGHLEAVREHGAPDPTIAAEIELAERDLAEKRRALDATEDALSREWCGTCADFAPERLPGKETNLYVGTCRHTGDPTSWSQRCGCWRRA